LFITCVSIVIVLHSLYRAAVSALLSLVVLLIMLCEIVCCTCTVVWANTEERRRKKRRKFRNQTGTAKHASPGAYRRSHVTKHCTVPPGRQGCSFTMKRNGWRPSRTIKIKYEIAQVIFSLTCATQ